MEDFPQLVDGAAGGVEVPSEFFPVYRSLREQPSMFRLGDALESLFRFIYFQAGGELGVGSGSVLRELAADECRDGRLVGRC